MKTEFDNLKLNINHRVDSNTNGDKHVLKVFANNELIAKKVHVKKSIRYFAIQNYHDYLMPDSDNS